MTRSMIAALLVLATAGCNGTNVQTSVHGQRMATTGDIVAAARTDMVLVGRTDDRRAIYARRGGGGGPGQRTLYLAIAPNKYRALTSAEPAPAMPESVR